jgi:hypothetical protein
MRAALATLFVLALAGPAVAEPGVSTYALVIGSNAAGPGQTELRYAEDDARRVGALLRELGNETGPEVVVHPTPDQLRARLAELERRVAADRAAGRRVRVFFYYSGHARAAALDLGPASMPLDELRARLLAIPATLTIVVLDACQSGAFSRVKGAEPAADFSFNSRRQLDATGVAVLASSSGSELSQESEQLRGSYFTHHLLVGLRGAGDANDDGRVSIDEAYRYAYHQTLLATAATSVGGQHVTLEVDLKGHGDVPLSFPRGASATIVVPAAVEGSVLVHARRGDAVIAETAKARGAAVRLAVPPGAYEVLIRNAALVTRCAVTAPATLDLSRCTVEPLRPAAGKGDAFERSPGRGRARTRSLVDRFARPLTLEVSGLVGDERRDGFNETLADDFGYREELALSVGLGATALRRVTPRLWIGGSAQWFTAPRWEHGTDRDPQRFAWQTTTLMAVARGIVPLWDHRLVAYGQLAGGGGLVRSSFRDPVGVETVEHHVGLGFALGAGLRLGDPERSRFGVALGYELLYAPIMDNLQGATHASGGSRIVLGLQRSY